VLIIVFGLVRGLFAHHENTYERIAREMTIDLQNNDLAGVQSFQNAETATLVTHAVVGRDADAFAPLGKLQRVLETPERRKKPRAACTSSTPRSTRASFTRRSASTPTTKSSDSSTICRSRSRCPR